jgi:hypothetical protein
MARRPTGLKATPAGGASATPKVPAGSRKPKPATQPKPAASMAPKPAARPKAALTPLVALRVSAAALALEAVGLAVAAVFAAINTVDGHAYQLGGGIAATLIALATASGLVGIAVCLATARPWTRIPTALTQLFVIIVGITLLQGHRLEWGVPALALAATCLAGLFTPASLRALNRPPIGHPKDR